LVEADDESMDFLTDEYGTNFSVKNGILNIRRLKLTDKHKHNVRIRVYFRQLHRVSAKASAVVYSANDMQTSHFHMDAHSGAEIELTVFAENVIAKASEGAEVRVNGSTKSLETKAGTGGEVHAFDLQSDYTYARATTGGMVYVIANKFIEAKSNLGGEVEYKGDPEESRTNTSLGGDVEGGEW
ncbi:MAG: DUF2807 domain-containing protein, partial [Bacteroidota bacterium]